MPPYAEEYAACPRFYGGTVLLNIGSAGFAHHSNPDESCLARFTEIIEMCIHAFGKRTSSPSVRGTKLCEVLTTPLYDWNILTK